ncbi:MAG TPA: Ig-like domain repeat protein [Thermoleophilia bacterium]|nr:Ig-like domain repeat protein [Thermoleophilia bacterium]
MTVRRNLYTLVVTVSILAVLSLAQLAAVAPAEAADAQLALGEDYSLLIKPDGSLFAWGMNNFGQLGLGVRSNRTRPTHVGADTDWAKLAAGDWHVLALKADGSLWAWGDNRDGRLGLGDTEDRTVPTRVGTDTDWQAIAAGNHFSLALKSDGTLWTWGSNVYGQLGLGDEVDRLEPTLVNLDADWTGVSAGRYFAAATKADGTLWTWGRNDKSQLGVGGTTASSLPLQVGTDEDWARAVCGDADVRALKTTGNLYAWGFNDYGQLGLGDTTTRETPTPVGDASDWALLTCGDDNTMATTPGGLFAWGDNTYGQLGQGTADTVAHPTPIRVGTATDWVAIASGNDHSAGLKPDGGLWVWGDNVYAQLGLGDTDNRLTPTFAFYASDVTAPTITSLTSSSHPDDTAWYADAAPTFEWTVSADESGVYGYSFLIDESLHTVPDARTTGTDPNWTSPGQGDGTWYFHVRAADAAGNWGPMARLRVKIDTTGPVTSDDATGAWSQTPVTVNLSAVDAGAGVAGTAYKIDEGDWVSGTQLTVSTEGNHAITYRSTDVLGNVESDQNTTAKIDQTPPSTTDDGPSGWDKAPVVVKFAATDAISGVASTAYRVDGGDWMQGSQVTLSDPGEHTIQYGSTDVAGNVETAHTTSVLVDDTTPVTIDNAPTGWNRRDVTVTLSATDSLSGMTGGGARTQYSLSGGAAGTWVTGSTVTIAADRVKHVGDGTRVITYRSIDAAGNIETAKTCTVKIDTRRPTPKAPKASRVRRGTRATLTYRVADVRPGSPTATVKIKIKTLGGRTVKTITLKNRKVNKTLTYRFRCKFAKKTYRFYVYATDTAGNTQVRRASNRLIVR